MITQLQSSAEDDAKDQTDGKEDVLTIGVQVNTEVVIIRNSIGTLLLLDCAHWIISIIYLNIFSLLFFFSF